MLFFLVLNLKKIMLSNSFGFRGKSIKIYVEFFLIAICLNLIHFHSKINSRLAIKFPSILDRLWGVIEISSERKIWKFKIRTEKKSIYIYKLYYFRNNLCVYRLTSLTQYQWTMIRQKLWRHWTKIAILHLTNFFIQIFWQSKFCALINLVNLLKILSPVPFFVTYS